MTPPPRGEAPEATSGTSPLLQDRLHVEVDMLDSANGQNDAYLSAATTVDSTPGDYYVDLDNGENTHTQSMRLRLRKQHSGHSALSAEAAQDLQRRVARVKKKTRPREARVFKRHLQLAVRMALGVLIAGVAQTRSDGDYVLLPESYYLGGLTVAAMMVIYAAANTVGGVLEMVWQTDLGVGIALVYNFIVFACVPMTQGSLMEVSKNFNGSTYYVSLHDWGITLPLLAAFTLIILLAPMAMNVKKFAVSTNLYFMLTLVDPMNPVVTTVLKGTSDSNAWYSTNSLLEQLAIYTAVGVVGTFIALATMLVPFPIFAMRKLRRHMEAAPHDIRDILNLIVDSYCFRAKDIKKMDFFRLRLDRLLESAHERLRDMEILLNDCWWEELVGLGLCFHFNKTVAKQFVKLYARLLSDLHSMKFAIETETCHWTHVVLLKKMQKRFYVLQAETNDLLQDISVKIINSTRTMDSPKFDKLDRALERLMTKYTALYGNLLSAEVHSVDDVGKTMPLNVFVYSFHAFVLTLLEFEEKFNGKNFSSRYRVKNFIKVTWRGVIKKAAYPRQLIIFAVRTTLAVLIGICCSTFIFAFSSTAPTAIAMVAEDNIGGTYSNTVNRLGGLVAGTVMPSIFNFFLCKASDEYLYNTLNNIVLFIWIVGSMYVWFSARYMGLAGMTSAFMSASVLLSHSCSSSSTTSVSYSALTENSMGILILMVVEMLINPRSARGLLRSNIQNVLTQYRGVFRDVFQHHLAYNRPMPTSTTAGLTEEDVEAAGMLLSHKQIKALREQLQVTIPEILSQQAKLVNDVSMEPQLWKPQFSSVKYTSVLKVCRELVGQLGMLLDLVEWHTKRRENGKDTRLRRWSVSKLDAECNAAFTAAQEPPSPTSVAAAAMAGVRATDDLDPTSPTPVVASPKSPLPNLNTTSPAVVKLKWDQSQDAFENGVEETFDALVTLFGEEFSTTNAEDHAIFLQMKEAFRIADVHRRGVVDASELAVLLEKLMPYAGSHGDVRMEQYVDEFMRLVDKDHDEKISFNEFMEALNEGFRLELEIYDDQPTTIGGELMAGKKTGSQRNLLKPSKSMRLRKLSSRRRGSGQSSHTNESEDNSTHGSHNRDSVASSFIDTSKFGSSKMSFMFGASSDSQRGFSSQRRFRVMSSGSDSSAPEALLNVESFTLTEAAAVLKQSYGECLLAAVDDRSRRVTMEDFIVMSCLINACQDIAANLTRLNTLAAT